MSHYDALYEQDAKKQKQKQCTNREQFDYCLVCGDKKTQLTNNVCDSCNQKYNKG